MLYNWLPSYRFARLLRNSWSRFLCCGGPCPWQHCDHIHNSYGLPFHDEFVSDPLCDHLQLGSQPCSGLSIPRRHHFLLFFGSRTVDFWYTICWPKFWRSFKHYYLSTSRIRCLWNSASWLHCSWYCSKLAISTETIVRWELHQIRSSILSNFRCGDEKSICCSDGNPAFWAQLVWKCAAWVSLLFFRFCIPDVANIMYARTVNLSRWNLLSQLRPGLEPANRGKKYVFHFDREWTVSFCAKYRYWMNNKKHAVGLQCFSDCSPPWSTSTSHPHWWSRVFQPFDYLRVRHNSDPIVEWRFRLIIIVFVWKRIKIFLLR